MKFGEYSIRRSTLQINRVENESVEDPLTEEGVNEPEKSEEIQPANNNENLKVYKAIHY